MKRAWLGLIAIPLLLGSARAEMARGNLETDESGNLIPDEDGFTHTQSWGQIVRNAGPLGGAAFGCNPNRAEEE